MTLGDVASTNVIVRDPKMGNANVTAAVNGSITMQILRGDITHRGYMNRAYNYVNVHASTMGCPIVSTSIVATA